MDPLILLVIVLAAALAGVLVWAYTQQRRSEDLRREFGPEYDRTVRETGNRRQAEADLAARRERVEHLQIHPLPTGERDRFAKAWRSTQGKFVDNPSGATKDADRLIGEVMQAKGYPVENFERRATDISVEHPMVVNHYRAAHQIAIRNQQGQANTEDLRKAMVNYRALFDDLLREPESTGATAPPETEEPHWREEQR